MRAVFILGLLFGVCGSLQAAGEDTVYTLDIKQATLTKQLNFTEQASDVYGRYLIIRDSYFYGNAGVSTLTTGIYSDLEKWYQKWPQFISRLSVQTEAEISANMNGAPDLTSLDSEFSERVRELDKVISKYQLVLDRSRQGLTLIKSLPRLSTEEFTTLNDPVAEQVNLIKKKNLDPHLTKLNRNLDQLQSLFEESTTVLQSDLLNRLKRFKSDVFQILLIKSTLYAIDFPKLRNAIERFERILRTDEQMDALLSTHVQIAEKSLISIMRGDFLEAEAGIMRLEQVVATGYELYLKNKNLDSNRVLQAKALTQMHLRDLKERLHLIYDTKEDGRREALAEFILYYSQSAAATCRVQNGELRPNRHSVDCNLFKKTVAPFLNAIKEKDSQIFQDEQLEVLVRSLKNTFRGPLAGADKQ